MASIGLIDNPLSDRNRRRPSGLEAFCRSRSDIRYARLEPFETLPDILDDFAAQGISLLAVAGGDGTVQAVLTALYEAKRFETPPPLALLAQGRTNLICGDVGVKGRGVSALKRLLNAIDGGALTQKSLERRLLRLDNIQDMPPQIGMFLGGAGIYRAIKACNEKLDTRGLNPDIANFITLAGLIGRWIFRRGQSDSVFHGDEVTLALDNKTLPAQDYLIVMATTLERMIFGTRPYWGNTDLGLRYTAIRYPPPRLFRSLPAIFFGGSKRNLDPAAYLSGSLESLTLDMECPFILDGQPFTPRLGQPVRLSVAGPARFLRV